MATVIFVLLIIASCTGYLYVQERQKSLSLAGKNVALEEDLSKYRRAYSEADAYISGMNGAHKELFEIQKTYLRDSVMFFTTLRKLLAKLPDYRGGNREYCHQGNHIKRKLIGFIDEFIETDVDKIEDKVGQGLQTQIDKHVNWLKSNKSRWGDL
ncbi:hypothetical protein KD576_004189 [Salmonella enterica subsp. enterica serovar Thompson]|nr:hypothetical protein [Salmonella enterica]EHP7123047.1 hypothetical protein [Salmonella enterica subsp. enterica serovar Thompson]EGN2541040.1 hypothetical protein [Salmonella enterica]EHP7219053.1 hypothetical protein [Salmonella enterica subsp. enterica serovar Thompson]HAF3525067.1 hypothetical protein [Salmonella enterica]